VSRTYEELEVGAVYRSRFGRTVLESDNTWFTLLRVHRFGSQSMSRARLPARRMFRHDP
jgi:hypothetical protein